jgi:hypothetical protein
MLLLLSPLTLASRLPTAVAGYSTAATGVPDVVACGTILLVALLLKASLLLHHIGCYCRLISAVGMSC